MLEGARGLVDLMRRISDEAHALWPEGVAPREIETATAFVLKRACELVASALPSRGTPRSVAEIASEIRHLRAELVGHAKGTWKLPDPEIRFISTRRITREDAQKAVQASGGNVSQAARSLGISRNTIAARLNEVPRA
jgi:DNA-binding NtrC family response regulator